MSATDLEGVLGCAVQAVAQGNPLRIVVLNHNKCWLARRDPVLRNLLEDAEIVAAESSAVWAARQLGLHTVGAAWGVVVMGRLLREADARRWTAYFIGATPDVIEDLVAEVGKKFPGVRVVGAHHGYLSDEDAARLRSDVGERRPDLLLLAMGSPRQEHFMAALGVDGGGLVTLGVGGSFDVHAGRKPDAPAWVRGSGFEWLYRALITPRLFRRYAVVIPWFVAAVLRERIAGRGP